MKNKDEDIFKSMENDILNSTEINEETKQKILANILNLKSKKLNLMITGATGAGKSSTINALFKTECAKVGVGVNPETMDIKSYELNNLILWDSPGLGDGREKDNLHAKNIIKKLNELDNEGNPLIDLVLVILDGSTRDLGTSYELINSVIIPNLGENPSSRIIVAINQADVALKGRNPWNYVDNKPTIESEKFLQEKVKSVKERIKEATGIDVEPIFYVAGYKDESSEQKPYNLSKLLYLIINKTPSSKRVIFANNNISEDQEVWKDNDNIKNYNQEIKQSMFSSIIQNASAGALLGEQIGAAFGKVGSKTGAAIGAVVGGVVGFFTSLW